MLHKSNSNINQHQLQLSQQLLLIFSKNKDLAFMESLKITYYLHFVNAIFSPYINTQKS